MPRDEFLQTNISEAETKFNIDESYLHDISLLPDESKILLYFVLAVLCVTGRFLRPCVEVGVSLTKFRHLMCSLFAAHTALHLIIFTLCAYLTHAHEYTSNCNIYCSWAEFMVKFKDY